MQPFSSKSGANVPPPISTASDLPHACKPMQSILQRPCKWDIAYKIYFFRGQSLILLYDSVILLSLPVPVPILPCPRGMTTYWCTYWCFFCENSQTTVQVFRPYHTTVKCVSKPYQKISHLNQIDCNIHSIRLHVNPPREVNWPDSMHINFLSRGHHTVSRYMQSMAIALRLK